MKYITIISMVVLFSACMTLSNKKRDTYSCVRNLVELNVPAKEAISFCRKNYRGE